MNTKQFFAERYAQTLLKKDQTEVRQLSGPGQTIFESIVEMTKGMTAKSILDYGCGVGKMAKRLVSMMGAKRYVGMDVVASVIKANKEYFADDESLTFKTVRGEIKGKFDLVWTASVLQHMDDAAVEKALANFAKILTAKGTLIVWVNTAHLKGDLSYMKRRKAPDYDNMMMAAGLHVTNSITVPVGDEQITVFVANKR